MGLSSILQSELATTTVAFLAGTLLPPVISLINTAYRQSRLAKYLPILSQVYLGIDNSLELPTRADLRDRIKTLATGIDGNLTAEDLSNLINLFYENFSFGAALNHVAAREFNATIQQQKAAETESE